jgi:hypothetical protein
MDKPLDRLIDDPAGGKEDEQGLDSAGNILDLPMTEGVIIIAATRSIPE